MRDLSILESYKDLHISGILEYTTDVPDEVRYLVEELCQEDGNDDWTYFLVKWLLIKNEEGYWDEEK